MRAFAILLVIGAHFRFAAPDGVVGALAYVWHEWGGFGVPLFSTLSGYLVGGLLITEMRTRGGIDVGRFLIRRGLKIWPAYFVFLAYLVVMPLAKGASLRELVSEYWPNALFGVLHLSMTAWFVWLMSRLIEWPVVSLRDRFLPASSSRFASGETVTDAPVALKFSSRRSQARANSTGEV